MQLLYSVKFLTEDLDGLIATLPIIPKRARSGVVRKAITRVNILLVAENERP